MTTENTATTIKMPNLAFVSVAALALTGCNQALIPDLTTTGSVFGAAQSSAYEHTLSQKRPVQEAFMRLPEGGQDVIEVNETRFANGVQQNIIYRGDHSTVGENNAQVRMVLHKVWPKPKGAILKVAPTTQSAIRAEMNRAIPGVKMRFSNQLNSNPYGPFGYAIGNAGGGVRCIYGWQHLRGNGYQPWGIFTQNSKKPEMSVRLRVCRGGVTTQQLVSLMRRLRIEADPSRVQQPAAVSWNAGPGGISSTALPGAEQVGYVSDPTLNYQPQGIDEAPVRAVAAPKRKSPIRKSERRSVRTTSAPANIVAKAAPAAPTIAVAPIPVPNTTASAVALAPSPVTPNAAKKTVSAAVAPTAIAPLQPLPAGAAKTFVVPLPN